MTLKPNNTSISSPPFGSPMSERSWSGEYRYGFQNQEQDQELWEGAVSFKYRVEDPRLGRFFSVDPLVRKYPWNSPYAFSENMVIHMIELEGLEAVTPPDINDDEPITEPVANRTEQKPFEPKQNLGPEIELHDRFSKSFQKEMVPQIMKATNEIMEESAQLPESLSKTEEPVLVEQIASNIKELDYSVVEDSKNEMSGSIELVGIQVTLTNLTSDQVGPYTFTEDDNIHGGKQFYILSPVESGTYFYTDTEGIEWLVEISLKLEVQEEE